MVAEKKTQVKSWSVLKKYIDSGEFEELGRTVENQSIYDAKMKELKAKYGSIDTFIRETVVSKILDDKAKITDGVIDYKDQLYLKKNDFPYALEPNIDHLILWSVYKLDAGSVPPPNVVHFIATHLGPSVEYLWLVNPPHLQSVPGVYHGHLFVKTS
ncbi:hypothetical protein AYI68_g8281 [Smittium mucronatum]|uniref:Uncharacterized protein n=1 Tax=Smittium mucronatum TaxID=133383 RepID=A0A1R0GLC2_9FUNG|nr:hypothetical protein AYI68_g8281 [Smittium mucronatum]